MPFTSAMVASGDVVFMCRFIVMKLSNRRHLPGSDAMASLSEDIVVTGVGDTEATNCTNKHLTSATMASLSEDIVVTGVGDTEATNCTNKHLTSATSVHYVTPLKLEFVILTFRYFRI